MAAAPGANKSQELIQQLLQAEKQGEELIATAKKNRLAKLRQAKEKAEDDLKAFREEQEAKFQRETGTKAAADPTAELKDSTKAEIDMVNQDYESNKAKTVQYIVGKVLEVPTELTATQKQALKMASFEEAQMRLALVARRGLSPTACYQEK
eukprot:CAMPEP_0179036928 /NCGR_PEP_ID=MMETSP0796-20121207/13867_1 /TAXON_ID=73915 /ORGANISM="Pyrodinium bahamense, Strain pbaha01" /LENGTH=151 /DNA_ID=CAMNT_0020733223 /DNA_START=79 /DNA_END=532 /DNA_ORIENTATION=-